MVALAGEYSHSMRRSNLGWVKGSCSAAFLIVILISVPGVVNCDSENISDSSSILENLLKSFQSENNSIKCEKDVKTVLRGLNEDQLWALRSNLIFISDQYQSIDILITESIILFQSPMHLEKSLRTLSLDRTFGLAPRPPVTQLISERHWAFPRKLPRSTTF